MIQAVAILFPVLFAAALVKLHPLEVASYLRADPDMEPSPSEQAKAMRLLSLYLPLSFGAAVPISAIQHALFRLASARGPEVLFQHRPTDTLVFAAIPGLFLGFLAGISLIYCLARYRYKDRFATFLRSGNKDGVIYRQFAVARKIGLCLAVILTAMNYLSHDAFIVVRGDGLSFSHWWSLRAVSWPIGEIEHVASYKSRVGPFGNEVKKAGLEIVFVDGSRLDTFYLIESDQQAQLIAALRGATGGRLPLKKIDQAGG